jgi:hypothetical protein
MVIKLILISDHSKMHQIGFYNVDFTMGKNISFISTSQNFLYEVGYSAIYSRLCCGKNSSGYLVMNLISIYHILGILIA